VQERTAELAAINERLRSEIAYRKQVEDALRESEQRFQDLYDNAPDMYFTVIGNGTVRSVNLFGAEYLGFSQQELVGGSVWSIVHAEDLTRIRRQVQEIFALGKAQSELEFRKVRKDGSVIWVHEQARLITGKGGIPDELRIICRDITERKHAEQALRKSEEQVRLLMDSVAEGIYGLDLDGLCTSCNSAALRLLGYHHADDVLGKNMHELIHHTRADGRHYPLSECPICEVFQRAERTHVVDDVLWRSDNTSFPAEYWSYPVRQNGRLTGAVVTFLDITERKQAEEALQKAKEQAELANAAKSRFLTAVSHDLRQPLQTLSLLVGILKGTDKIQGPVREVINSLEKTMFFMDDLLDTLLDINRLQGGYRPHVTDISVAKLFSRMKSRFEHQAEKKGLELHVIPCRAMIHSDQVLLERMVQNFLSNAVRYTSKGKVLLGCRRRGSKLSIEVWDTGPGIPEEQRSMVFEDYYQLNNPARDRQKGLGLGLAIVDRGARLLGLRVEVHSTVSKGSMFSIEVPLAKT
jgi:PAS domain S-box-containing protein